jgi:hypothetical protein
LAELYGGDFDLDEISPTGSSGAGRTFMYSNPGLHLMRNQRGGRGIADDSNIVGIEPSDASGHGQRGKDAILTTEYTKKLRRHTNKNTV